MKHIYFEGKKYRCPGCGQMRKAIDVGQWRTCPVCMSRYSKLRESAVRPGDIFWTTENKYWSRENADKNYFMAAGVAEWEESSGRALWLMLEMYYTEDGVLGTGSDEAVRFMYEKEITIMEKIGSINDLIAPHYKEKGACSE